MYCNNIFIGKYWVIVGSKLSGHPGTGLPGSGLLRDRHTTIYMRPNFSILIEGLTKSRQTVAWLPLVPVKILPGPLASADQKRYTFSHIARYKNLSYFTSPL